MTGKRVFFLSAACGLVLLVGCAGNKNNPPQYEPCKEMVTEMDGIRGIEKQLTQSEDRIKKYRTAKDSSGLNSELGIRDALMERKKLAQFAADKTRADCNPAIFQQVPPVDQTQYREERERGK